jgi:hypothetical protein
LFSFWPFDKNDEAIHVEYGFVVFDAASVELADARSASDRVWRCMVRKLGIVL